MNLPKSNPEWVWDRTVYLTTHGSRAYGTDTPTSDVDMRGFAIPPKKFFYGYHSKFEQYEFQAADLDIVVYDIRKFFKLAADCNPNIIEILFTDPSDHIQVYAIGKLVLENRDLFLSSKAFYTFGGYAFQQLQKIKAAQAKDGYFNCKDAMHLVRLMRVGKELLETGKVNVKRKDKDELLSIRNGAWTFDEVISWADKANNELLTLAATTSLPKTVDHGKIEELLVGVVDANV
jgi:uncharacterized protein